MQSSVHASQKAGQGQVDLSHISKLIELVNHLVSKSQSTLSIIVNQKQSLVMDMQETPAYLEQIYTVE